MTMGRATLPDRVTARLHESPIQTTLEATTLGMGLGLGINEIATLAFDAGISRPIAALAGGAGGLAALGGCVALSDKETVEQLVTHEAIRQQPVVLGRDFAKDLVRENRKAAKAETRAQEAEAKAKAKAEAKKKERMKELLLTAAEDPEMAEAMRKILAA